MKYYLLLIFIFLFISCDGGLEPPPQSFLKGKVTFVGGVDSWPSQDSVNTMRIVAFLKAEPTNIVEEVLNNRVYFLEIPSFVDEYYFELLIPNPPQDLNYIAVAWQFSDSFFDQLAAGVYTESGDNTKPSSVQIEFGKDSEIEIFVDFNNLPPQPFE